MKYILYDPADFGAVEIKEDTRDAEITRLREELAAVTERMSKLDFERTAAELERDALRDENARLREALKPFSKNYWSEDWHDGSDCEINVQLRDIRRAASLVDGYVWTPDE